MTNRLPSRHGPAAALAILLCVFTTVLAAPTVRITSPVDGAELEAEEKFIVSAEVSPSASGGRVVKVEFFVWSHNLRVGEAT